jgi:hypothetical protein
VLDVEASNIDGFQWTDTCVSSPQLNRPIWEGKSSSTLKTVICRKNSFQTWTQFSVKNNVVDASAITEMVVLGVNHVFFFISDECAYLKQNEHFSTLKNVRCT